MHPVWQRPAAPDCKNNRMLGLLDKETEMNKPTRKTTREYRMDGGMELGWDETTDEALCSVELGATAKGEPQIKSVKAYAATAAEAAAQALETFGTLVGQLRQLQEDANAAG